MASSPPPIWARSPRSPPQRVRAAAVVARSSRTCLESLQRALTILRNQGLHFDQLQGTGESCSAKCAQLTMSHHHLLRAVHTKPWLRPRQQRFVPVQGLCVQPQSGIVHFAPLREMSVAMKARICQNLSLHGCECVCVGRCGVRQVHWGACVKGTESW
jgi:hypothetical protein